MEDYYDPEEFDLLNQKNAEMMLGYKELFLAFVKVGDWTDWAWCYFNGKKNVCYQVFSDNPFPTGGGQSFFTKVEQEQYFFRGDNIYRIIKSKTLGWQIMKLTMISTEKEALFVAHEKMNNKASAHPVIIETAQRTLIGWQIESSNSKNTRFIPAFADDSELFAKLHKKSFICKDIAKEDFLTRLGSVFHVTEKDNSPVIMPIQFQHLPKLDTYGRRLPLKFYEPS